MSIFEKANEAAQAMTEEMAIEQTYEEALLAAAGVEAELVINKLLHDQADLMTNLATARVLSGVRQRMLEWGLKNNEAVHEERERNLHRMVNRLRSENHEVERRYNESATEEAQP